MLSLYFLSCYCLIKVCPLDSTSLSHAFCNLCLVIMTDFTLSDEQTHNHFITLAGKVCSSCHSEHMLARFANFRYNSITLWTDLTGGMTNGSLQNLQPSSPHHRTGRNGWPLWVHRVVNYVHACFLQTNGHCTHSCTTKGVLDLCNAAVSEKLPQCFFHCCPLNMWQQFQDEQTLHRWDVT